MNIPYSKVCSRCGKEFPLTEEFWYKAKTYKYGFHAACKQCERDRKTRYRLENPEKDRASKRKYVESNREVLREKGRQYKLRNQEQETKRRTIYREKYHDKHIAYNRHYRKINREKISESSKERCKSEQYKISHAIRQHKRRATKSKTGGSHTYEQVWNLFRDQEGYCFHCGVDLIPIGFHQDHWIPISRGGSDWIENIRLLCPLCNWKKHNKLPGEWDSRYCD